jgi:hypothetical protein
VLDLDFLRDVLDPRITFTRGSTATRVNASGRIEVVSADVPRFDYDPLTLRLKGLLIEESRTNLVQRSEELDDAYWTKTAVTITSNSTVAPDGNTTMDTLVEDTSNNAHYFFRSITVTNGAQYTHSAFVKKGTNDWCFIYGQSSAVAIAYFNLTAGTIGTVSGSGSPTAKITDVGGGIYRLSLTYTTSTTSSAIGVGHANGDAGLVYTGTSRTLFVWGLQAAIGNAPSSYMPTTSATFTRSADVALITGANFSTWFNPAEGTFFISGRRNFVGALGCGISVDDNTANNTIQLCGDASANPKLEVVVGGASQASIDAGTMVVDTDFKFAGAYKLNDFGASIDGGSEVATLSGSLPVVDRLRIGANSAATNWNGTISALRYFDRRLATQRLTL